MRNWGGAIKWIAIFATVVFVSSLFESCRNAFWQLVPHPIESTKRVLKDATGHIPVDDPKRPLKKVAEEDEIRALAAICLVDAAGEKPAVRQKACRRLMENALRYRAKYGDDLDSIFRLAKTLYPRDRTTPKGWAERSVSFVFRPTIFLGYRKAERVAALNLAKQLFEGAVPPGCAIHNTRAPRETTDWYDEHQGAVALKETMYEVPESDPLITMRSYCLLEEAPGK